MKATERARKISTLSKLLQGDKRPLEELRPTPLPDLSHLSDEELLAIIRSSPGYVDTSKLTDEEVQAIIDEIPDDPRPGVLNPSKFTPSQFRAYWGELY